MVPVQVWEGWGQDAKPGILPSARLCFDGLSDFLPFNMKLQKQPRGSFVSQPSWSKLFTMASVPFGRSARVETWESSVPSQDSAELVGYSIFLQFIQISQKTQSPKAFSRQSQAAGRGTQMSEKHSKFWLGNKLPGTRCTSFQTVFGTASYICSAFSALEIR